MEEKKQSFISKNYSIPQILIAMYIIATLARFIIALNTSVNPAIMADETLYFSLSRSLSELKGVLLRGQPVRYEYILYPLLIAPLHWLLPAGLNMFRAIQFLNCTIMHLGIIPAYFLGKKITGKSEYGLLVALIAVLTPDIAMVNHVMSESLTYPLILALLYFGYTAMTENKKSSAVICGVLTFLSYITKPAYALIGLLIMCALLMYARREKSRAYLNSALTIPILFAGLFVVYKLILHGLLGVSLSDTGVYTDQVQSFEWSNILNILNGTLIYAVYVLLAFLVIPILLPLSRIRSYKRENKYLLLVVFVSMLLIVLGTVYGMYLDELSSEVMAARIHTRYIAPFLVVLFAFCLAPEVRGTKLPSLLVGGSIFTVAGILFLSSSTINSGAIYSVDSMLLSLFLYSGDFIGRIWVPIIVVVFLSAIIISWIKNGFGKKETGVLAGFMAGFMLISNIPAYEMNKHNMSESLAADAAQAYEIAGEGALLIVNDGSYFWPVASALDTVYRGDLYVAEISDALANIEAGGILSQFIPDSYWKTDAKNYIPSPPAIIFDVNVLSRIAFSENANSTYTLTDNGYYAVITPGSDNSWLHSCLVGFEETYWARDNGESKFIVYDRALLEHGSIKMYFYVRAGIGTAEFTLSSQGTNYHYEIDDTLGWIYLDIEVKDPTVPLEVVFTRQDVHVYVSSYLTEPLAVEEAE